MSRACTPDEASGILVRPGNAEDFAEAIRHLMRNPELRMRLGRNAAGDARHRFDLHRHADDYLNWYGEILQKPTVGHPSADDVPAATAG
jgi:glycosyltransferase involved in cell wall biosynthesis